MTEIARDAVAPLPRELFVVAGARAVSVLGTGITLTVLLMGLHHRGAGGLAIAGLLAASTLPAIPLAPAVGLLVDRFDSRLLIVASSLWQAAACLLLAFVDTMPAMFALVAAGALGAAVSVPVFGALTPLLVPERRLAAATGVQQGAHVVALLAGPPAGGLLIGIAGGVRVPLLVAAASFAAVVVPALLIDARRQPPEHTGRTQVREAVGLVFGDGAVAAAAVLATLLTLNAHVTGVAQVFLVLDTFRSTPLVYGLLSAAQTVGVLVGTTVAGRLRAPRRILRGCLLTAATSAGCYAAVGTSRVLAVVFVLHLVAGVGFGMASNASTTLVLLRTRSDSVGRALASLTGVLRSAALIGQGIGGLVVGPLAPRGVYLVSGTVLSAAVLTMAVTRAAAVRKAASGAGP